MRKFRTVHNDKNVRNMIDKVQKIREEVERLMYGFNLEADIASCEDAETEELANIKYQLCKKILDYIDKVQEEPVSENLGYYINELSKQFPDVSFAKLSRIAVRVAKWQEKQDQSTIELAEDHAMLAGMNKMEQQIMAKAIDGEVLENYDGKVLKYDDLILDEKLSNFKVFDKVKIIVIKED